MDNDDMFAVAEAEEIDESDASDQDHVENNMNNVSDQNGQQESDEEDEDDDDDDEDEGSGEEGDTDDASDEEEDQEPQLKYKRIKGSLDKIFEEEGNFASALAVSDKFIALGTHLGKIYILDLEGNFNMNHKYVNHTESINDLCIDESGEFLASCGNDGKVVVQNLYKHEPFELVHGRPINSVSIDPSFLKSADKSLCFGGKNERLILNRKGWFSRKDFTLHKGEGAVYAVRWKGSYIAWANDVGVKIYDISTQSKISYIKRPKNAPRPDMYRCCLVWSESMEKWKDIVKYSASNVYESHLKKAQNKGKDSEEKRLIFSKDNEEKLIIAWGNYIQIVSIIDNTTSTLASFTAAASIPTPTRKTSIFSGSFLSNTNTKSLPGFSPTSSSNSSNSVSLASSNKVASVTSTFGTNFHICGVAPYDPYHILVLCFEEEDEDEEEIESIHIKTTNSKTFKSPKPELKLIDATGTNISCDVLSLKDYEKYFATDYRLEYSFFERVYYILSQKDILTARPRDIDDHIDYLIIMEQFEEALKCCKENEKIIKKRKVSEIGKMYLNHLIKEERYEEAAKKLPGVCHTDAKLWEEWIQVFMEKDQFKAVASVIPIENPTLQNQKIYDFKLTHYSHHNQQEFLNCIKTWPLDIYDSKSFIVALEEARKKNIPDQSILLNALTELYLNYAQYDKALGIYLQLKKPDVFEFIEKHNLFPSVNNKVYELWNEYGEEKVLEFITRNSQKLQIDQVVNQLKKDRKYLLKYLHELFKVNKSASQKYHLLQVELYAQFDTDKLLRFLEQSQSYDIEKAQQICQESLETHSSNEDKQNLYRCIVYLIGRMGNANDALQLIIDKLEDMKYAIQFVEDQKDPDLWKDLIKYSMKNSKFISELLDNISEFATDHIDPISLIKDIPEKTEIPDLKSKLAKIIGDYSLQMTLQQGCLDILQSDIKDLSVALFKKQRKAVGISSSCRCVECAEPIKNKREDTITFFCAHTYHLECYYNLFHRGNVKREEQDRASKICRESSITIGEKLNQLFGDRKVYCLICNKKEKEGRKKKSSS